MLRRLVGVAMTSVAAAALAMVAASFLAHRLGPVGMGEYQGVVRWASIWMIVGMLAFPQASSYYSARAEPRLVRLLVGNSLRSSFAQSFCLIVGGYLIAPYLFRSPNGLLGARIYLLCIPTNLVITYLAHIAIGRLDTHTFNVLRLIQAATFVVVVFPLALVLPTSVAPLTAAIAAAGAAVVYTLVTFRKRSELGMDGNWALWRRTAAYGLVAYPGIVGRELSLFVDQLLIWILLPSQSLGFYAAAASGASVTSVASAAFFYLAQPETQNVLPGAVGEAGARMSRLTVILLLPLAIVLSLIMPWAIPIVYGPLFLPAIAAAQLLCFAGAIDGLVVSLAGAALGTGRPVINTGVQIASVATEVVLVLALVPHFGITGAAVATLVAYSTCAVALAIAISRPLGISPSRFVIPELEDLRLMSRMLRAMSLKVASSVGVSRNG
jgi:O-antigen/teichoic acid export membrane protein